VKVKKYVGLVVLAGSAGVAWQGGIPLVGLSDADAQKVAEQFFSEPGILPGPAQVLRSSTIATWKAKGPAERTQAVREMALYARNMVSSPAFEALYNGWTKEHFQAVDHGLKTDAPPDITKYTSGAGMQELTNQIAATTTQALANMPPKMLKDSFDQEMAKWQARPRNKEKLLARGDRIAPLYATNPEEFKKQYLVLILKSMEMGGPDTAEGLQALQGGAAKSAAQALNNQQARTEQKNYNEHRLKVEVKRRLTEFVELARSVDFSAQTESRKNVQIFVNRAYEHKSDSWKMLYRLGRDPTLAMVAVAEQWLKEL